MVQGSGGYVGRSAFRDGDSGRSQQGDSHTNTRRLHMPLLSLLAVFSLLVQPWTSLHVPASISLRLKGGWWKKKGLKEVYCLCPAGAMTGGPEALHQLCNEINLANGDANAHVEASMLYVVKHNGTIVHRPNAQEPPPYKELYDSRVERDSNPLVEASSPTKLLVWPEIWVKEMFSYLESTPTPCRCAIYWLSVDNFHGGGGSLDFHRNDILHLTQSEYARQFVVSKGAPRVFPLEEYIPRIETTNRTIDVLYNPKKGLSFTNAIRERSDSMMNFRPIAGTGGKRLTPDQVQELLSSAKVYIDFGNHPGMDRIPREAALAGCVVITNMQGSAQYSEDVPIPPQYKIKDFNVDIIHNLLLDVIRNYETHSRNFDEYREWIRGQRPRMKQQVESFLKEI